MAIEESQQPDAGHVIESASLDGINIADILPDSELFAAPVESEFQPQQVFSKQVDMDLFKPAEGKTSTPEKPVAPKAPAFQPTTATAAPSIAPSLQKQSLMQKIIAACLVLIVGILVYAIIRLPSLGLTGLTDAPDSQQTLVKTEDTEEAGPQLSAAAEGDKSRPVSLGIADDYYLSGRFDQAAFVYKKLLGKISTNPQESTLRDFLRLRLALCLKETVGDEEAVNRLRMVTQSESPVIRMMGNYHLAQIEMDRDRYIAARSAAYQALALIDTLGADYPWSRQLHRNCRFLVVASLSNETLSLSNADTDLPAKLWKIPDLADDPFAGLSEDQLRTLLMDGSEKLARALLGPRIIADTTGSIRQWTVTCDGTSINELLNRFAANAGLDLCWTDAANKAGIRQRPVAMHLPAAVDEDVIAIAAGSVGLVATIEKDKGIQIYNPAEYEVVSEQIALLGNESIARWRKFLLAFHEDRHLANVHFALGLLYAQQDLMVESMAEYKIVANRFPQSLMAPAALYNSGRLKADLRDYDRAYKDLLSLVEQYPDSPMTPQAYLALAEMTARSGQPAEAAKLYRKIYYLNTTGKSQAAAALAAGEIYYNIGDYPSARKWLGQHIDLKTEASEEDVCRAYFLLGKTQLAMGKSEEGCAALQKAVSGQLPQQEYLEAITAFVESCLELGHFLEALDVLEEVYLSQFSQSDSVKLMILKSRLLREVGLVKKAVVMLGDRQDYVVDTELKGAMGYELALCYIQQGQWEQAFKKLAQNMEIAEPGPVAHQSALRLAEVSLKLNRSAQAMIVCQRLLKQNPAEDIRQETLKIMADIHSQQKNYENAALTLMGQVQ